MSGPLKGLKVIEFGGIGPGPFCAMMLADMGADVIRLDRKADKGKDRGEPTFLASGRRGVLHRGRRSVAVDLKSPEHRDKVLALIDGADALIEGYRPGVMERLGLGPDVLLARNPRLVFGRMTGWGQEGPLAQAAGHDINYIALSGALATIGRKAGGPIALAQDGDGAVCESLGGEDLAVHPRAGHRHEDATGNDPAAIGRDARHDRAGGRPDIEVREQRTEIHVAHRGSSIVA